MSLNKIKAGDNVLVTTGRSKGQTGRVLKVLTKSSRLIVDGVNTVKKHVKPNPNKNEPGGIIEKAATIHISNVALYNPVTLKGDRVGVKVLADGKKVRYFKSNNEVIED